ncbi:MAG: hypothetical protein EPN47_13270 [Acidobacteria bacterium]|nr:MAG: hypothetical protein EPN47_13270 [Acidobacteriota bacterium]
MANTNSSTKLTINRLIMYPALITLCVTLLRLVGELLRWPGILFGRAPGGSAAIIGISWLPIIFGPYFAIKLFDRNLKPSSFGKTILFAFAGFVVLACGATVAFSPVVHFTGRIAVGLLIIVGAAALQYIPWRELAQTLIAYAFLARIPVVIVMFFAMRGNWGTHYDAVPAPFDQLPFWTKYLYLAVAPQLIMWVVYTMTLGALIGGIYAAIVRRK